jgi:hypothetical protein
MDIENEELKKRIIELEKENEKLKKTLENYNNSRKSYYEKNKEIIKEKALTRLKKLSEEKSEKYYDEKKKWQLKLRSLEAENIALKANEKSIK